MNKADDGTGFVTEAVGLYRGDRGDPLATYTPAPPPPVREDGARGDKIRVTARSFAIAAMPWKPNALSTRRIRKNLSWTYKTAGN